MIIYLHKSMQVRYKHTRQKLLKGAVQPRVLRMVVRKRRYLKVLGRSQDCLVEQQHLKWRS